MTTTFRNSPQSGFTLLEVLIAMGLGLFLIAGALSILNANKGTFITQQEVGQNQETGRATMYVLAEIVRMGGYSPVTVFASGAATAVNRFPAGAGPCLIGLTASQTNIAVCGNSNANGDVIFVRYVGNGNNSVLDCTGNPVAAGAVVTNLISLSDPDPDTGGTRSLTCRVATGTGAYAVGQPIADGVSAFTVQYGVDTNFVPDSIPNQYLPFAAVTNWTRVRSVRMTVVARAGNRQSPGDAATQPLSHTFTSTVVLRNMRIR